MSKRNNTFFSCILIPFFTGGVLSILCAWALLSADTDVLYDVRQYLQTAGSTGQDQRFARLLSKELKQSKDIAQKKEIFYWSYRVRTALWHRYPTLEKSARSCGSLGAAMFLENLNKKKSTTYTQKHAMETLIQEAWLFSQEARHFLSILVERRLEDIPNSEKENVWKRIKAFYVEASAFGRHAEAYQLALLKLQQPHLFAKNATEEKRFYLLAQEGLEKRQAYWPLLKSALQHANAQDVKKYWLLYRKKTKASYRKHASTKKLDSMVVSK